MAHFAEIGLNNIVERVIVVHNNELLDNDGNEVEQKGIDFCKSLFGGTWVQTSYNRIFRKNFAVAGYTYDTEKDAFIPPKPYDSWTLNEESCRWEPPTQRPNDGQIYTWIEANTTWILANGN